MFCRRFASGVVGIAVLFTILPLPAAVARGSETCDSQLHSEAQGRLDHGAQIANAGDVNGDGIPDSVVSHVFSRTRPRYSGAASVVFGRRARFQLDVERPGNGGFLIKGATEYDYAGSAVAGAGDVNGDGLDDVIVGAFEADNNHRPESGTAYVIFGKKTTETVHLRDFDSGTQDGAGFRIDGANDFDLLGDTAAGLGDVNGDGLDDIAVATGFVSRAYVVFGRESTLPVDLWLFDLNLQGPQGYVIHTHGAEGSGAGSLARAGDVNGDGVNDLILGIARTSAKRPAAYVVFGKSSPAAIDATASFAGYRVYPPRRGGMAGASVAAVGDMTRDGHDDVAIGAWAAADGRGSVYVLFGKSGHGDVDLNDLGQRGFVVRGHSAGDGFGMSVAGIGDVGGGPEPDIAIGAPLASYCGFSPVSGAVYVIFGQKSNRSVHVKSLGKRGYRLDGGDGSFRVGSSVAPAGRLNRDDIPDLLAGSDRSPAYVVWGKRAAS